MTELGRAGRGAALLVAPRTVPGHVHHFEADTKSLAAVRILGARHLAQASLSETRPRTAPAAPPVPVARTTGSVVVRAACRHRDAQPASVAGLAVLDRRN